MSQRSRKESTGFDSAEQLENTNRVLRLIREKDDVFWSRERERKPLELFHLAARRVPAYKDFLRKNKIAPEKIKTFKDFQLVPPVSKKNYLREYPIEKLCWDGSLKKPLVWTSTSGSTGEPFYFPRGEELDWQSSVYHELFLENEPSNKNKSTLAIVCFGMGVWIGGLITYQALKKISGHGYPMTILTPGPNKKEIFESLKKMKGKFDQLVLCGYPPFIKDVVDEASQYGVRWSDWNVKIIFAAEAFSEKFRDYIVGKAGIENKYKDTMNIYGSADLGTMAEETPLSIVAREIALGDREIYKNIFHDASRTPTLVQFNPLFINFDAVGGEIFCTGDSALPLVRYAIGDRGGVLSYGETVNIFKKDIISLKNVARSVGISKTVSELPFLYVYERTDMSTKLYGAIIYAEHVRDALQHNHLSDFLTGKFTMSTEHDRKQNEYLEINVELKPGVKKASASLKRKVHKIVVENLLIRNAEYRNNYTLLPGRVDPKIILWRHEHPIHFKPGIKQKWVKAGGEIRS